MKNTAILLVAVSALMIPSRAELALKTAAPQISEERLVLEDHVMNLDGHGNLKTLDDGNFQSKTDEDQYFRNIISKAEKFAANPSNRVLIFIHGGLTGKSDGVKRFNTQAHKMKSAGYWPIFILWPSGIASTYGYHLVRLRPPERSNAIEKVAAVPLNLVSDLGRAVVRSPLVVVNLMRHDFNSTDASDTFQSPQVRGMLKQHDQLKQKFEPGKVRLESDHRGKGEMVGRSVLYFITLGPKLVTAPLIDAFGKSGWHEMNARLDRIASRQVVDEPGLAISAGNEAAMPALARFFDLLEHSPQSKKITLVGHSMGAILINKMLPDFKAPLDRVVFLAAACSIDEFDRGTLRYLEQQKTTQFFNMTLHPAAEGRELNVKFLDCIPRGSLLVWIDEFLDQPRSPGQRRLGKWANFYRVDDHVPGLDNSTPFAQRVTENSLRKRTWVRGFGVGDPRSKPNKSPWNRHVTTDPAYSLPAYPQTHGSMAAFDFWKDDYLYGATP